ncbi:formyl transferase [bacterium]|nr:formyl transferase [bacterium]
MSSKSAKVLLLGPADNTLAPFLRERGELVVCTDLPLDPSWLQAEKFDFLVSYGYRHILKKEVLDLFPDRAINLHISYLPWNRGADPNLWSFIDGTPKGVTVHYLDEGVDTGDILVQKRLFFDGSETLASSYLKLKECIEALFREHWVKIRTGRAGRSPQVGQGSCHRAKEKEKLGSLLAQGWDTPVSKLRQPEKA